MSPTRSVSQGPPDMLQKSTLTKSKSTNSLRTKAALQAAEAQSLRDAESSFHTIRDPRMASTLDLSRASSTSRSAEKDEVAVLSDKLIAAINHQQNLDDNLAQTRHELESANAKSTQLEAKIKEYESQISNRQSVQEEIERLRTTTEEIRKQNEALSQEKRSLQSEMENLSASLFEEANKMVASANEQRAATEKKNQQLRDQIRDGEAVIASQIEQLAQLKLLMQDIGNEHRKELADSPSRVSMTPASPQPLRDENLARLLEAMNLEPVTPDHPEIAPSPSTQLTHLIKPQCRTDVPTYEDFKNMVSTSNPRSHTPSHAASRAGSGSYGGLSGLGLGGLSQNNSSSPNLSTQNTSSKLTPSPGLPGSFSPAPDQRGPQPLKDTRFFKRLMVEDIEPTLRLDLSPTVSWLQRRSILAAVADSSLIVEPIPDASQKLYGKYTSCSVCGEARREGQNPRTHAMRTREGEGANKWAVCQLCLEKVRAVGDLIGYVRMVRDGVVKIADLRDEEEAWEEIIRLRERLFWARLAGGVVPAFIVNNKSTPATTKLERPGLGHTTSEQSNKENENSGFKTPDTGSRRTSEEDSIQNGESTLHVSKHNHDAYNQNQQINLQPGLDGNEGLTTFENAREKALENNARHGPSSVPGTPPRGHSKRESSGSASGFPRISIPKMPNLPQGFWQGEVNTLH
ncbi:rab guanine nucleotide exchange factor S2 [Lithohypha guttulata]|uniref:Rab guanine nucleotide exchange factor S2 n=1 Tax=Lithohypha guttulata TaxID=1690604 RepID=A0AAN7T860_9EURO|nr:rab guanine nucleotide exchange factor S2 [Lithohypha guttulata]KAK5091624.1 rab guanine nucleotide exchange factor S2 [Lithohypha guttulata]